jgi:uncharacterized protein (DUF2141 family)
MIDVMVQKYNNYRRVQCIGKKSNILFINLQSMISSITLYLFFGLLTGRPVQPGEVNRSVIQSRNTGGISLTINNIRNKTGFIQINVFDSETGYPDKADFKFTLSKDTIVSGRLRLFIPLRKPGSIGISVLDDENGNEKMDFVFGIKPREGFGFSNNPRVPGRKPPPFEATRLNFMGGIKEVNINLKYI